MKIQELNETRLVGLMPTLQDKARQFISDCRKGGFDILITQGLRTFDEQAKYYAQGRTASGNIVTNAKPGESWHNYGCAIDIVPLSAIGKADWDSSHPIWQKAADIGEFLGLVWGGRFKSIKDKPHFELTRGLTIHEAKTIYGAGDDDALHRVWFEIAKKI